MQRYFASPEEYSSGEQNVVSRLPSFADAMAREVFSCNSLGERQMFLAALESWIRWGSIAMPEGLTIAIRAMKFVVSDIEGVTAFYKKAFGFELENTITLGDVTEHVLRLPGSELSLVLVRHGDEPVTTGTSYGPLVIDTNDVKTLVDGALAAGGTLTMGPLELPTLTVAMVNDPEGHPLELLHLPTGEIDIDSLKLEDLMPN